MPSPQTPEWAMGLTVALAALILLGIAGSWVLFRGRLTEGTALWVHLLAVGVFPLFLLIVGNFAVLEYSKELTFCGACHVVMKPYVDDVLTPSGESLASLHFQHRFAPGTECYSCHATYGLHGTFEAKLSGLRHVYRYTTGTYRLPIRMNVAFDNGLCLKCHEGAKRFMAEAIHLEDGRVSAELRTGQTECTQCHGPAHGVQKPKVAKRPSGAG